MNQTERTLTLKFKDDNSSKHTNEIQIPLHPTGQTESFVKVLRFGQYRSRQYEIVIVSTYDTVVVGLEEDLEVGN